LKKSIVLTEIVGYYCFIIFQYYYLNIKILKFYENWNFLNFLKILKYWNFWKSLIFCENFEFCWNFQFCWNFWNLKKKINFWNIEIFWGTQWVVYREQLVVSLWVNFHKTLKLFQVMWFNLSQWEVSEV
jgi:hypothetical protein